MQRTPGSPAATTTTATTPTPGLAPSTAAMASLALATLTASLGASIANVALPTLATTFDVPFHAVQWVVIAYLLTSTAVVVGAGRLGDQFGARRLLLFGIAGFAAASLACGLAPTLPLLVAARAAQGVGAAFMLALTVALVRTTVGRERTGAAMGWLGTMSAVGTAIGPTVGGLLVASTGWRPVFLAILPLAALTLWLARRHLPREAAPAATARERFDAAGMAWLALTLGSGALALTLAEDPCGPLRLGLAAMALLGGVAFAWVERRATFPLLDLALLQDPGLRRALLRNGVVSAVLMATLVVGPFHLLRSLGLEASTAGLVMSIGPLASAVAGVPAGRLVDRFGPGRMAHLGLLGVAAGAAGLALQPGGAGIPGYLAAVALMTSSYALFQAANNTAVLADVAAARRGVVSGLLGLSRNLGLMTGAALLGALFAAASGAPDVATAAPAAVAAAMRTTFGIGAVSIGAAVVLPALLQRAIGWRMRDGSGRRDDLASGMGKLGANR